MPDQRHPASHIQQALAILDEFPVELEGLSPRHLLTLARRIPDVIACLRRITAALTEPATSATGGGNAVIEETRIDALNLAALALETLESVQITPEDSDRRTTHSEISLIRIRSLLAGVAALLAPPTSDDQR